MRRPISTLVNDRNLQKRVVQFGNDNTSVYRVTGGIAFKLLAVGLLGVVVPAIVTAIFLLIASVALFTGV